MKATNIVWDVDDPEDLEGLDEADEIDHTGVKEAEIEEGVLASVPILSPRFVLTVRQRLRSMAGIRTAMDSRLSAPTAGNG